MALQIQNQKIIIMVDVASGAASVLNGWTANDSVNTQLTQPGAAAQRTITSAELSGTLANFLQGLLGQAQAMAGV